jgi:hypothetical protein
VYYRISADSGTREGKLLEVLREMLAGQPFAEDLREWFQRWFDLGEEEVTANMRKKARELAELGKKLGMS